MTMQVESLQPGEDRAAGPAADPVWHPWYYPDSRSIPSRRGQLEAFCLHLLQFMNPPSGAQSRLCLWVSVTGRWGLEKKKKTPFFSPFSWRDVKHTQKHTRKHTSTSSRVKGCLSERLSEDSAAPEVDWPLVFVFVALQNFMLLSLLLCNNQVH